VQNPESSAFALLAIPAKVGIHVLLHVTLRSKWIPGYFADTPGDGPGMTMIVDDSA
jgi:hypothetical protein